MKSVVQIAATLFLLSTFLCCELAQTPLPFEDEIIPTKDKGALKIELNGAFKSSKTLAPPIAMEIGSYDIRGEGPDPAVDIFENLGNTTGSLTRNGLKPGAWTITVEARNPDVADDPLRNGTIIGYGEAPAQISAGMVTTLQITVTPLSGTGELALAFQWIKGSVPDPSILATLTPAGSATPIVLDFAYNPPGNPDTGEYADTAIEAGYYFLILQFMSGTDMLWGTAEAVRILAGELTSHTFTYN